MHSSVDQKHLVNSVGVVDNKIIFFEYSDCCNELRNALVFFDVSHISLFLFVDKEAKIKKDVTEASA